MWIDITVPLNKNTITWPSDPHYSLKTTRKGDCVSSIFSCSSHAGTHMDSPLHHILNGANIEQISLSRFCGIAQVIEINTINIISKNLESLSFPRVIFKTNSVSNCFQSNYCYISPESARVMVDKNILLIGTDTLSVDQYSDKSFSSHKILLEAGIPIVEQINTRPLHEGIYEIIVLPLNVHAEASPVRMIAREIS